MPTASKTRQKGSEKKNRKGKNESQDAPERRQRVVIEGVTPEIDAGRFPIKRVVGEQVLVEVDMFADGHDAVSGVLQYRKEHEHEWQEVPLEFVNNDRWHATFQVSEIGRYRYTFTGWVDHFQSWLRDLSKRLEAGQQVDMDLLIGSNLIHEGSLRAKGEDANTLASFSTELQSTETTPEHKVTLTQNPVLLNLMAKYPPRQWGTTYDKELAVVVDRERARFSSWYEMFPRSCSSTPGHHGTFKDCEARLPYIAGMGFNILYLPPIHPIGETFRKGKNNNPKGLPEDVGSPWGIGAKEGGHTAIHPSLGTLKDFKHLLEQAKQYDVDIALDIAFQCSPDHPYVQDHPEWFQTRPDGTIQYAENPPKKYQDIYPLNFENDDAAGLWQELTNVVSYWAKQGVRIFRVDNPHTKPFRFWEYLITTVKNEYPETIFLAEAFTRPKIMYHLAKLGFTQSYTYFTWRHTKVEFAEYLTELTETEVAEFFRPNFWPNTPDILIEHLQTGGEPAFMVRLILAATLSSNYGIYGPAFELREHLPFEAGSEEYLNSEKYEIKTWDLERTDSLKGLITLVNRIRAEHPALQQTNSIQFHSVDNEHLLCYSKQTPDLTDRIVIVANLHRQHRQSGTVTLQLESLGLDPTRSFHVHDLLTNGSYQWNGPSNYVDISLEPVPAHIFFISQS